MSLIQTIRDSKDYKTFKKMVLKVEEAINVDRDRNEALAMHAGRTSRKLYGRKAYSPKAIIEASLNDLSARARLVEIRVQTSSHIDLLHDAIKAMRHSINVEFAEDLSKIKTVGQRQAFVDRVVAKALNIESEGKALIALMDDLVTDIDKASYHLRVTTDALKILIDKPGQTL